MGISTQVVALLALMFSRSEVAAQSAVLEEYKQKLESTGYYTQLDKGAVMGLESIRDFDFNPEQESSNLDEIYETANEADRELKEILSSVSLASNTEIVGAPIKRKERAKEKVFHEFDGKASLITDIVRDTLIADSIGDAMVAYKQISDNAEVVRVRNRFNSPQPSGYRDLSLLVKLPKTKMVAEVQIHMRAIAEVKSGPEHDLYEIIQGIERNAKAEGRVLSSFEIDQISMARNDSKQLYKDAWSLYIEG